VSKTKAYYRWKFDTLVDPRWPQTKGLFPNGFKVDARAGPVFFDTLAGSCENRGTETTTRNAAMQINLPPAEQQHLATLAAQHGFATAEEYASHIVSNAVQLETFAALSPDQMQESVRSIERGLADVEAGRSQPAHKAMDDIAKKFGFTIPRQ